MLNKILLFSDLHAHVWKKFGLNKEKEISRRLFEQQKVLNQIYKIILDKKINTVIFGGDLFHKVGEIPIEALNVVKIFFSWLDKNNIKFFLVDGNHDLVDRENPKWFESSLSIFKKYKTPENIRLVSFNEVINEEEIKGYDLVVLHKTPIGGKVGNYEFTEGVNWKKLAKNNKYVFFGHIHQNQQLSKNCYIIGSPMHLTFGDIGDRGVYVFENNTPYFIKLEYPEFITVENSDLVPWDDYENYYRVLNASKKSEAQNVIDIIPPPHFEERIKSNSFNSILKEWLNINKKPQKYLDYIEQQLQNKIQSISKVFKGKIIGLAIKNFISIGEIIYKPKNGFTLLKGKNEDSDSNGSGKTSMVDAIYWCLFGKTTKGLTGDDVIKRGEKDCKIILGLKDQDKTINIIRTRKKGLQILINNKDISEGLKQSDRQTLLETEILGFNSNIFLTSCYFSQENLQSLTDLSDTEKTNMITNLLGFEEYDNIYNNIFDSIKDKEQNKLFLQQEIQVNGNEIEKIKVRINSLQENITLNENKLKGIEKEIKDLEQAKANIKKEKELPLSGINYDEKIKIESEKLKNKKSTYERTNEKLNKKITDIQILKSQLSELENKIASINSIEGICDKCGSKINKEHKEKFTQEYQEKISSLTTKINTNNTQKEKLKTKLSKLKEEIFNLEKTISFLNLEKVEELEKQTKNKQIELKYNSEIERINSLINEKRNNTYKKEIENYNKQISQENGNILSYKEKLININQEIEKIEEEMEMLEFWKFAFSPKGIRSVLLDKFCNDFNSILNDYISQISNRMRVVMDPISSTKSGETRNKISLNIEMDGVSCNYTSLSGGEKRRIDIALCLALNKWVSQKYNIPNGLLGILVLDELFSYIDKEGEENIATLLYNEGRNKIILVISHTPSLESFAEEILIIEKRQGTSKLIQRSI